eukprot:TRINITY_DN4_c0_g1_i1.p1 TRINITY_DN4_c0_g1~~TRINITY_DN4_c0_g1_i1.p1  ORF type:complete len:143 (-),score=12.06 TRINITY_DN4_c0_g1_i1:293-721(-)
MEPESAARDLKDLQGIASLCGLTLSDEITAILVQLLRNGSRATSVLQLLRDIKDRKVQEVMRADSAPLPSPSARPASSSLGSSLASSPLTSYTSSISPSSSSLSSSSAPAPASSSFSFSRPSAIVKGATGAARDAGILQKPN